MSQRRLRQLATAIVVVPLLIFPLAALAGSGPEFPSRDDCARAVSGEVEEELAVVYGRLDDPAAAAELLAEITRVGFTGAEMALDACGKWRVSYNRVASFAEAEALAEQVRAAGFDARVELED